MAASLRSQSLIQRLAACSPGSTLRTTPFLSTSRKTSNACILCQHRLPSSSSHNLQLQRRNLASSRHLHQQQQQQPPPPTIPNPPNTTTHYTIFPQTLPSGPPPSSPFSIPLPTLKREFFQLQNNLHPDKYPPGPLKRQAETLSARINEAHRTLSDPLLRAQYLLKEIHGIDVTAEDGASQHPLDPELLMEVMDVQEAIESAEGEGEINEIKKENDERIGACVDALGRAFDEGDVEGARGEAVRLKFWYSVAGVLREWEPGVGEIRLIH